MYCDVCGVVCVVGCVVCVGLCVVDCGEWLVLVVFGIEVFWCELCFECGVDVWLFVVDD